MDWLNYHHLLYFWTIVQEGSTASACERLGLAQPTVSSQVRRLEKAMGHDLFDRSGKRLRLTEFGRMVARYADDIFSAGKDLVEAVSNEPKDKPLKLTVGVADVVPKLVAYAVLEPPLLLADPKVRLEVQEGKTARLLASLALYDLDVVLTDSPIPDRVRIKAFNHLLGECETGMFGTPELARRYREQFPRSLQGAPMLLPTSNTAMRKGIDGWMELNKISCRIVADFEDSALMKVFGQHGHGLFPAPLIIAEEVEEIYGVELVGVVEDVVERFYAISTERRITHPAVARIYESSRNEIFA